MMASMLAGHFLVRQIANAFTPVKWMIFERRE